MDIAEIECGWRQFEEYCEILADRISLQEGDAIAVLKASRDGGVFLGRMMELLKGVGVHELNYSVKETEDGLLIEVIPPFPAGLAKRRVFLLTEIVNSGRVLNKAVKDLLEYTTNVIIGSIYYREGSVVPIDIQYIHLIKVDRAVRFTPWE